MKIMRKAAALAAVMAVMAGCAARERAATADVSRDRAPVVSDALAPAPETFKGTGFAPQGAPGQEGQTPPAFTESALALPQSRMVIKTAYLSVRVTDVEAAFTRAIQLTESNGGYVQSSTQSVTGGERADLTLRIPPDGFLPLIKALEGLGAEEEKSITGQDVTEEYFDLQAELSNKQEVQARLLQLLAQAKKVEEAIQVEQQLERVGSDVNRIKGRMKYLDAMVGLSTVNLSLFSQAKPVPGEFINWSLIGNGFVVAARALVRAFFFILQALIVVIPLAAIAGGVTWGVIKLLRSRRKTTAKKAR